MDGHRAAECLRRGREINGDWRKATAIAINHISPGERGRGLNFAMNSRHATTLALDSLIAGFSP